MTLWNKPRLEEHCCKSFSDPCLLAFGHTECDNVWADQADNETRLWIDRVPAALDTDQWGEK